MGCEKTYGSQAPLVGVGDKVEFVKCVHGFDNAFGSGPKVAQDLLDVGMGIEAGVVQGFSP